MRKNKIKIIVGLVSTLILLMGGTYAAYTFFTEKTPITMLVGGDQISFNAGANITVDKMFPVYDMEQGIIQDIEIYKQEGEYVAGIDLYLNLKTWPSALSSPSFRWTLYKNDAYLSSGDFSGQKQGNNIKLTSNSQKINLEESKDFYKLYLWIDALQDSDINMMNQSFTVNLYGQSTFYIDNDDFVTNDKAPNHPELADGMIPIKYNYQINEWVKADTSNIDNDWYDYYNKIWANAVTVKTESREEYMNADIGTTINEDDILAYYVWIPRYRYILFNTDFLKINPLVIQVEFQKETDEISTGTENGQFLTHPAFWWDDNDDGVRDAGEELAGIWVGKFKLAGSLDNPIIKPNVTPILTGITKNHFNMSKNLQNTNYLTALGSDETDCHMIKNMEWGAIVYLVHSKYGKNGIIPKSEGDITGVSNSYTYNDFYVNGGKITSIKNVGTGVLSSTTGNVYGIYDIRSSNGEMVAAGGSKSNPISSSSKYYDTYETAASLTDYSFSKLGDATGETLYWSDGRATPVMQAGDSIYIRKYFEFFTAKGWTDATGTYGSRAVCVLP